MTKLTDTQTTILHAAAERDDHNVLPLPGSLRGGAAGKVIAALLSRGLINEMVMENRTKADAAVNDIWRNDEQGRVILLHLTDAGREAVAEPDSAPEQPAEGGEEVAGDDEAPAAKAPSTARTTRAGTKQATLIQMLRATQGATIAEICDATGWQAHTVRGAFAGALKKRLGLEVTSEKVEGRGRVYRSPAV